MNRKRIEISAYDRVPFRNLTAYCIGTGRMDLALHQEYQEQLKMVQEACHFSHIRGHGIFSDQMGIYQGEGKYCFTYLDRVMDSYLKNGLRPFLELGFMPEKLASGTQTVFYWKGHVTPPKNMEDWTSLVKATLRHLSSRYGEQEVACWPCEIWNEPNLTVFWENADKDKYLDLYEATALAVKEAVPEMKVGGPAICGGEHSLDWIRDFLSFCERRNLPVDFVTRHAYLGLETTKKGRYTYHDMADPSAMIEELRQTRLIMQEFPSYQGLPLYVTEFNTSYNPFCPIHDTNLNAVICASLLSRLSDVADGYSYWTFGDVFEEQGIPSRPFHGGFGLTANGRIPKPTFWTFAFFAGLEGQAVYRDGNCLVFKGKEGGYEGILWNPDREETEIELVFPLEGECVELVELVDETSGNPLKAWHELGEPADLTEQDLAFLRSAAKPHCVTLPLKAENGFVTVSHVLSSHAVLHFKARRVNRTLEEGYDYNFYR